MRQAETMRAVFAVLVAAHVLAAQSPEQRAVDYLARETPRWSRENKCFSCHNNGDAARALYVASRLGYKVPKEALADTTEWLARPAGWDSNRGDPAASDKRLARIQFSAALVEATADARIAVDSQALRQAAESLLPFQETDGSWPVDVAVIGSPTTYGTALATYMARRTLETAYNDRFSEAMSKATLWFLRSRPKSILDQAAVVLALATLEPIAQRCVELLLSAQLNDGGWGPYPQVSAEPFDTAVAMLALQKFDDANRTGKAIARGRTFLTERRQESGGWPATTRPAGAQSYAQHISTSAWATLALILTDPKR